MIRSHSIYEPLDDGEVINLICGAGVGYANTVLALILTDRGYMSFVGDQHNPSWAFDRHKLSSYPKWWLIDFYLKIRELLDFWADVNSLNKIHLQNMLSKHDPKEYTKLNPVVDRLDGTKLSLIAYKEANPGECIWNPIAIGHAKDYELKELIFRKKINDTI